MKTAGTERKEEEMKREGPGGQFGFQATQTGSPIAELTKKKSLQ